MNKKQTANPKKLSNKGNDERKLVKNEKNLTKCSELFQIFIFVFLYFGSSTWFHVVHNEWSIAQAFYYSVQSGLSIGFGVLTEADDLSRLYTVLHVLIGAIAISVSFSLLFERVMKRIEAIKVNATKDSAPTKPTLFAMITNAFFSTEVTFAIIWVCIGIAIGVVLEGWSVIHSLYFALTGISTAGLEGPSNIDFNLWVVGFYVLLGVPIFSEGTGKIAGSILEYRRMTQFEASVRSHKITRTKFNRLSSKTKKRTNSIGSNGSDNNEDILIDRFTFLCHELVALGLVKKESVDMINARFDTMDESADGFVTFAEAKKKGYLVQSNNENKKHS